jgi:mRNA-degrading endonuclease toxin of MazEF toxin-antitoxin module
VLTGVDVAPVTQSMCQIPTEITLGKSEGLRENCVASFDNHQRIRRCAVTKEACDLGLRRGEICDSVRALTDC